MSNTELLEKANQLRKSGQNDIADVLYDELLKKDSNNTDFLFNKALNIITSNPKLALDLFEKVIQINPDAKYTYRNIAILSTQTGQYQRGIDILTDYISQNPDSLETIHERATIMANSGNVLKALIEFYFVVEHSNLQSEPELFIKHQIASDIAFSKTQLRNQSMMYKVSESYHNLYDKYKNTTLTEFQYMLPKRLFGNENYHFLEGRYEGESITDIIALDPEYINNCIVEKDSFFVSEEIIQLLEDKGVDTLDSKIINTIKIHQYELKNTLDSLSDGPDEEDEDSESDIFFL